MIRKTKLFCKLQQFFSTHNHGGLRLSLVGFPLIFSTNFNRDLEKTNNKRSRYLKPFRILIKVVALILHRKLGKCSNNYSKLFGL